MGLEKINAMRKEKGISLDELSQLSGVPKGTLSKITAGITTNPSLETVRAIVTALGYTLDDLEDEPRREAYTDAENLIIQKYRRLPDTGKQAVESMIDTMLAAQPEPQDRLVPVKVSGVMDIPGDYVAPESAVKKAQERMTPVVAAAFGDDGSEPQLRMVSEEAVYRAAEGINRLMAESKEADRERAEADARTRAAYAQDKKKKRRK